MVSFLLHNVNGNVIDKAMAIIKMGIKIDNHIFVLFLSVGCFLI
jgi:hypothetical protein